MVRNSKNHICLCKTIRKCSKYVSRWEFPLDFCPSVPTPSLFFAPQSLRYIKASGLSVLLIFTFTNKRSRPTAVSFLTWSGFLATAPSQALGVVPDPCQSLMHLVSHQPMWNWPLQYILDISWKINFMINIIYYINVSLIVRSIPPTNFSATTTTWSWSCFLWNI